MDYNKLIERFNNDAKDWAGDGYIKRDLQNAADALSMLQIEKQLLWDVANGFKGEIEKFRADLDQMKRERDSSILFAQYYTEKVDNPCTVCRHRFNETGAPMKKRCENCGPTGTPECGWEFDFNWDLKED